MRLDGKQTFTISVKKSGSDNRARILGQGITASCTCSAADAVQNAVNKLLRRNDYGPVTTKLMTVTDTIGEETWLLTVAPIAGPVAYPAHRPQHSAMEAGR